MLDKIAGMIERLDLSYHKTMIGGHFPEIIGLLAIVFGGSFLLFAWKHHEYFLGITGLLVGSWAGLILKAHLGGAGEIPAVLYLAVCAVAGAYLGVYFRKFMGMLLGGFSVAVLGIVFVPDLFEPGNYSTLTVGFAFLLGGGLGAMFHKFFFIFNTSLIGSAFLTYGLSAIVLVRFLENSTPRMQMLLHVGIFLPLLLFGVLYQLITSQGEAEERATAPAPRPRPYAPPRYEG
jgi:hypothetical protein